MKRLGVGLFAVGVVVSYGRPAWADGTPPAVEMGLRSGFAIPLGSAGAAFNDATKTSSLSDLVSGQVPLWFDLGVRITPSFYFGAFVQYGFAFIANGTTTGCGQPGVTGCSGSDIVVGGDFHVHFLPDGLMDPWAGVGIGYEWLNVDQTVGSTSESLQLRGWQFLDVQLGADYKFTPSFGLGPFMAWSFGEYSTGSVTVGSQTSGGDVKNATVHEWATFGLRGVFDVTVH
jgi:hypothetical protein